MQRHTLKLSAIFALATTLSARYHHRNLSTVPNWTWSNTAAQQQKTQGQAQVSAGGKSAVGINIGAAGVATSAISDQYTNTGALFNSSNDVSLDQYQTMVNADGSNNAARSTSSQQLKTQGGAQVATNGFGGAATGISDAGVGISGQATNGMQANGIFNSSNNLSATGFAWQNVAAPIKGKRLLGAVGSKPSSSFGWNNNFATQSALQGASTNETWGNGSSQLHIGSNGIKSVVSGSQATSSKNALKQQDVSSTTANGWGKIGGKSFGWNNVSAANKAAEGFTDNTTIGEGGSFSDISTDGVDVQAAGSKYTNTNGGLNRSENASADTNAFGNNYGFKNFSSLKPLNSKRRLMGRDEPCDEVKKPVEVNYKALYEKTKAELMKLSAKNAELVKDYARLEAKCTGHRLGASSSR